MMKMNLLISIIVVILVASTSTYAYQWVDSLGHPNYPGQCVYRGVLISPNSMYYPSDECLTIECMDTSGIAYFTSCDPVDIPPNCQLSDYELDLEYPYCCDRETICY
ncbi:uncharacterized protein LOC119673341 [Teleopsis dalmanni]|uniref:uncharacterized protein LOC119673255 n=1 Tax=Teleopsis dalmanni TaxID=139649 RepID=UPI0018CD4EF2|nr:uncharacterized protein LOC119673255 [Teleopsis dalmanni]XP_037940534.1 uncharacterized protein LOC119673341 [Teleopsis dalmanni]